MGKFRCCIDLSCNIFGVSIFDDKRLIDKFDSNFLFNNKSKILFDLLHIFKKNKLNINLIQEWIIGLGPGNFTGLRILSSFILGHSCLSKIKCFGIPSALPIVSKCRESNSNCNNIIVLFCGSYNYIIACNVIIINNNYFFSEKKNMFLLLNRNDIYSLLNNDKYNKIVYIENIYIKYFFVESLYHQYKEKIFVLNSFPTDKMFGLNIELYRENISNIIYSISNY